MMNLCCHEFGVVAYIHKMHNFFCFRAQSDSLKRPELAFCRDIPSHEKNLYYRDKNPRDIPKVKKSRKNPESRGFFGIFPRFITRDFSGIFKSRSRSPGFRDFSGILKSRYRSPGFRDFSIQPKIITPDTDPRDFGIFRSSPK